MTGDGGADKLDVGGHTDVGKRKHNEDAFLHDPDLGLTVVADGVGGHEAGEVASGITCQVLQREVAAGSSLTDAISKANIEVAAAVKNGTGKPGMASTVVAVLLNSNSYEIAWVGDSRAYLWDGRLSLLTRDHSFVEAQLAMGRITPEEAQKHPRRNVILQAIGLHDEDDLDVGHNRGQLTLGSSLLLCSDGVTDPLDNEQLSQLLMRRGGSEETCQRMVKLALQCGGRDNATAVLLGGEIIDIDEVQRGQVDETVWVFDPRTGEFEGQPDLTPHGSSGGADSLGETQIMRVPPMANAEPKTHGGTTVEVTQAKQDTGEQQGSGKTLALVVLAAGLVAAAAWFLLM